VGLATPFLLSILLLLIPTIVKCFSHLLNFGEKSN
jgi:hypothetical protein